MKVLLTIQSRNDIERNREKLRKLLVARFDYAAMARQSLGNRWVELKGQEKEFVAVFAEFLQNSYGITLGSFRGEKIVYDRDQIDGELRKWILELLAAKGLRSGSATSSISRLGRDGLPCDYRRC